jgi:HD-GYP domain-containing protein (c-di-GMP phosphodiesterase class II)
MTRPSAYRRHRPLREALAELSYCAGSRLDPEIAARLIELIETGRLRLQGQPSRPSRPRTAAPAPARSRRTC